MDRIEDVILGCANQAGEDNGNVARMAALLAGLPVEIPGQTVNRLCGSGLQAVTSAAHAVRAGDGHLFVAGGVESMTRAPYVMLKSSKAYDRTPPPLADSTVGWRFVNPRMRPEWTISLGATAERVAAMHRIGRAALVVASAELLTELNLAPLARIVSTAVVGVDPSRMGLGPVPASRKALERAGLTVRDLDLIELNEAFAAQAFACMQELDLDPGRVNIYGGAIALGHPLGASGARILTTLVHALRRIGGRYGLATMCIGVGQGIAMVVEAVEGAS